MSAGSVNGQSCRMSNCTFHVDACDGPEKNDDCMQASGINIFSAYNETVPLWDFHLKDRDCTHFCNPSGYELWTFLLKEKLFHLQPWLAP